MGGSRGEAPRNSRKFLAKILVFLPILSFIFEFVFFPRFGLGTFTFCLFIFPYGGMGVPPFPLPTPMYTDNLTL